MTCFKLFLAVSLFSISVLGQASQENERFVYVQIPRNIILPVIAVQPNCPIAFEEVGKFAMLTGGFFNSYRLRNIGTKPIRAFTVATSDGTEIGLPRDLGRVVLPGELVPEPSDSREKIVPLTSDLRDRLKLTGPMRGMVILIVVNVEFTDGTSFHDEATYKAMTAFMDKIGDAMRDQEEMRKNRRENHKKF